MSGTSNKTSTGGNRVVIKVQNSPGTKISMYTNKILNDPRLREMSPTLAGVTIERMFDEKVAPYAQSHGIELDKEQFLSSVLHDSKGVANATARLTREADLKYKSETSSPLDRIKYLAVKARRAELSLETIAARALSWGITDSQKQMLQARYGPTMADIEHNKAAADKWLGEHYDGSMTMGALGMVGEQIPMLPVYGGVGKVFGVTGSAAKLTGPALKAWQLLGEYAAGFTGARVEGKDVGEANKEGLTWAGMEAGHGAAKFLAKVIGIGGKKLATEAVTEAAKATEKDWLQLETRQFPQLPRHYGPIEQGPSSIPGQKGLPDWEDPTRRAVLPDARSKVAEGSAISDPVIQAHMELLNKEARARFGRGYQFVPLEKKLEVLHQIGIKIGEAVRNIAAESSEVISANVDAEVKKASQKNPAAAKLQQALDATRGGRTMGQNVAANIKRSKDVINVTAQLVGDAIKPVEGAKTLGAASSGSIAFTANTVRLAKDEFKEWHFERPSDALFAALGLPISDRARSTIIDQIKTLYPEATPQQIMSEVVLLKQHMIAVKLEQSNAQGAGKHGLKVFRSRSTILGESTKWTSQLNAEVAKRFGSPSVGRSK